MKMDEEIKITTKTALVTGGTGFIGSNLVRRLVADGWEVHCLVREGSNLELLLDVKDEITFHRTDGSTTSVVDIFQRSKPKIVFHLAAFSKHPYDLEELVPMINSNISLPVQILEAMSRTGVDFMINTGTFWQHYEGEPYNPVSLYSATKQAFQDILRFYTQAHPIRAITLILFDTYGPGDPRPKLFNQLTDAARTGHPMRMTPGEQMLDLVYIDDVVEGYMMSAKRLVSGQVSNHESFAISAGEHIRLRDFVDLFQKTLGSKIQIQWGSIPYREREVMVPWSEGAPPPGWEPKTSLQEGLKKTFNGLEKGKTSPGPSAKTRYRHQ